MTGTDPHDSATGSTFSLTSFLQRLLGQSAETQSADDQTQSSADNTSTATNEPTNSPTQNTSKTNSNTSKTPEERTLYRLIPNHSVSGVSDPYVGSELPQALRSSSVSEPSQFIIGLYDGHIRTWFHTPLSQSKVRQTVFQAKSTATMSVEETPAPETLSTPELLDKHFDLQIQDGKSHRTLRYLWESPDPFPLWDRSVSITDIIERLNDLWCFVLFTIDIAPGKVRKGRLSGCNVRFEAQIVLEEDCDPAAFEELEQTIRSVFRGGSLSPTLYDRDDDPPFQTISTDTLAAMTTLPSPTELHRLNVTGADSPIDDQQLSPQSYLDPSLPLGWVADSQATLSSTPVGYGQSRHPVTLLRVNPPRDDTADVAPPRSEYLANIRALAATPYPVFVPHTRPTPHEYLQAIDAELESNDDIPIRHEEYYSYEIRAETLNDYEPDPTKKRGFVKTLTNDNSVYIIDLSNSDTPRVDLSGFVATLEHALRETPETDQSVACGVAINDAGTMLFDGLLESLAMDSALTSRANVILNCQYPVGTSVNHGATPGSRTTAKQTDLLQMLSTEIADGTLFANNSQVRKLLDRLDFDDDVREAIREVDNQVNWEWLWYDRTAPTTQPVVGGMRACTDDSERPLGADELLETYGPDRTTLKTLFDLTTGPISSANPDQPQDATEASSGTQSQSTTPDSGGQPDTPSVFG